MQKSKIAKVLSVITLTMFLFTLSLVGINQVGSDLTVNSVIGVQKAEASTVSWKYIASGTPYVTKLYAIRSGVPGPVMMVVGGTHGNEEAGYLAADQIKDFKITKGILIVIPRANATAIKAGTRTSPGVYDLNRSYPQTATGRPNDPLAAAIWQTVKDYKVQYLMDLHEGYNYHLVDSTSVGQSLIYYPTDWKSRSNGLTVVTQLNKSISIYNHRFTTFPTPVPLSLARATSELLGVHGYTFETCDKQPLSTRINQHMSAVRTYLKILGMQ
ncbi:MAG: succinylglutamate desuccinylase/aspartoacylase family protein [Acidobacteriota bacterium]